MNVVLWVLQILLALHTVAGAVWKLSNSEEAVPSLSALPHGVWASLGVLELLSAAGLVLAAVGPLAPAAPIAAAFIAAEMLLFCVLHLTSGSTSHGEMVYWLVVAAVSAFIAYGRFVPSP